MAKIKISFFTLLFVIAIVSMASPSIITDTNVFKPLKNTWTNIQNGGTPVEAGATDPFYGIFLIKFKLAPSQYYGNLKVYIYIQKNVDGDTNWYKIAEVAPPAKPSSGDWEIEYTWNSRLAAYEWTNTTPFKTSSLKLKFKVIEE